MYFKHYTRKCRFMYAIEAFHLSRRFRDVAALAIFILIFQFAANRLYKKFNE
jgi:hypothetical protein